MRKNELRNATVVITGASSGIGRATALAFARQGARLVLAARREAVLHEVVLECEQLGATALAVPTDVTNATAVQHLAETAARVGGGIDIWINNAGAGAIGPFSTIPLAVHEQVIRVNLFGSLYGAYAVLPYFRQQGYGTLLNVISLGAWLPEPYTVAYSASKYGLRGLMDTLRTELTLEPNIHVCDVHPAYIDTPGFQHGANYTGRLIKPAPPVFPAQQVAAALVRLAQHPRPTTMVGWSGPGLRLLYRLAPAATRWSSMRLLNYYLRQAEPAPITEGSLFTPTPARHGTDISGGWRRPASASGGAKWVGAVALAAGAYAWWRSRTPGKQAT
ncbi:SDR family oxidoreductase [Hymenobacter tibetensis]|uniref:SDR family oxidoreductase n=1 Tax=Hymenobacter tibetensis TaxID=497967 RepID=A0ABY4CUS5_9BACT|nr:SDR family oxidoreductase [Hymenobacter tibetensis]UOG73194.1 SDR family oxidoreductase [Hymenobacter tibetensis]